MLICHALQALYHQEYDILVQNTWMIWCLKYRVNIGTKEVGLIYTLPKYFLIKNKVIFRILSPSFFREIYNINYAPHIQMIQIETDNYIIEDTDMRRKIEDNKKTPPREIRYIKQTRFAQSRRLLHCGLLPVNHCFPPAHYF